MHNLYSMCILSVLSVGYIENVKAYPAGGSQIGIIGRRKAKIVNGTVAQVRQFPWIASIKKSGGHQCGGTIISDRYILSAAHCFKDTDWEDNKHFWSVTLGDYDQVETEDFSVKYGIRSLTRHENYKYDSVRRIQVNDIVLLELSETIKWTKHIQPVALPKENIQTSNKAIAAGWGKDPLLHSLNFEWTATDESNNKLRLVEMDIFGNTECNDIYRKRNTGIILETTEMCAGKLDTIKDTNDGDSGGPLLVNLGGREVLVGITSQGSTESIYPKSPGVYVRVFEYMDWIMKHVHKVTY